MVGVAALAGLLATGCSGPDAMPAGRAGGSMPHSRAGDSMPDGRAGDSMPAASGSAYVVPSCPDLPHRTTPAGGLPDLELPCLGAGPAVRLADLRGTPTVLNVWAAWCTICDKEMPVLASAMHRAGDRVRFFGVHYKAPAAFGRQSAADFGVPFPSVQDTDGDRTTLALRVQGPPTTLFYGADGSLAGRHAGAITSPAEMDRLLRRYLGVEL
jgi:thiol-disulfide isomerase/thioredoxin